MLITEWVPSCCIKLMLKDGDKLRREGQLRYQSGENTIVVLDDMNDGSMNFFGYKMPFCRQASNKPGYYTNI